MKEGDRVIARVDKMLVMAQAGNIISETDARSRPDTPVSPSTGKELPLLSLSSTPTPTASPPCNTLFLALFHSTCARPHPSPPSSFFFLSIALSLSPRCFCTSPSSCTIVLPHLQLPRYASVILSLWFSLDFCIFFPYFLGIYFANESGVGWFPIFLLQMSFFAGECRFWLD